MHIGRTRPGLAAILFLFGCSPAPGDEPRAADGSEKISLSSAVIDTRGPSPQIPEALRAGSGAAERYLLVKYPRPITAAEDRALRDTAARVYAYLPSFAYLVRMPEGPGSAEKLASAGAVWSGIYHPYYKMSRAVRGTGAGEPSALKSVLVQFYPDADLRAAVEAIRALGISSIPAYKEGSLFSRARLLMTPEEIARHREAIARIPEVFWIDIEPRRALLNDTTVWVGQSGLSGGMTTPVFTRGLYGHDQIIGVLDTGIDPDMCYFRDPALGLPPVNECNGGTAVDMAQRKVIAVDFLAPDDCNGGVGPNEWDNQDHGTHVAGTVAGDNFASVVLHDPGDGMAPGAKLVIQDGGYAPDSCADLPGIGCPVVDLKPIFQQVYDQGARIHTNSWGDQEENPVQNTYTAGCEDVDQFMWEHKDMLLVFAAGNSGPDAESVGSPSVAKSALSVGATQRGANAGSMAGFSSCGPTADGRIKPEVTIPGQSIESANSDNDTGSDNCNTRTMSGTSMAAPAAAGLAALVRQYYQNGFHAAGAASAGDGFNPSGALIRATLVGSAQAMNNGFIPGNCQGWGRIALDDALYFKSDARRLWVSDDTAGFMTGSSGEAKSFVFTVHASGAPFKVTLAWSDFPSTPAASPHLNNDLDLEVTGPGGSIYYGNVFAGGESAPGGSEDRINTLEQVLLKNPAPGEYTVSVRSFNVPNGPQPFALLVMGASKSGTLGAACAAAADCLSGFCADGVCCSVACDGGACEACSSSAGAKVDGDCEKLTGSPCDDGDACSQVDICNAGVCTGNSPVVCAALDQCHDAGVCDSATGECSSLSKPDGTACDDGSACSKMDACQAGVCTGADPVICAAVDQCHEAGFCDPATGLCDMPAKPDGTACDDGIACTAGDTCELGVCTAGATNCPTPDACHTGGACDIDTGNCVFDILPDGTPCPGGACKAGACVESTESGSSASSSSSGGGMVDFELEEHGGCGCRVPPKQRGGSFAGIFVFVSAWLFFGARRRRSIQ
ncbi:MAG: S8 family serine peptidase [Polyangiaceae bacterium]|nr:S8 family serine peptidase [Polyangiaceae bacterium]